MEMYTWLLLCRMTIYYSPIPYRIRGNIMASTDSKKVPARFANQDNTLRLRDWDPTRLEWRVEQTSDARTVIADDGTVTKLDAIFMIVPYYTYTDSKVQPLIMAYDHTPVAVSENTKYGRRRQFIIRLAKNSLNLSHLKRIEGEFIDSCSEFIVNNDCTSVLKALSISMANPLNNTGEIIRVPYTLIVTANRGVEEEDRSSTNVKLYVKNGEASLTKPTKAAKDIKEVEVTLEILINALKSHIDRMWRRPLFYTEPEEEKYSPGKFLEVTAYPKAPKSDSPEDKAKYEIQKEEGYFKTSIWFDKDQFELYGSQFPVPKWPTTKHGAPYLTDYLLMKYHPKNKDVLLAMDILIDGVRISTPKDGSGARLVVDETPKSADFMGTENRKVVQKENPRLKEYKDEMMGRAQGLAAMASDEPELDRDE